MAYRCGSQRHERHGMSEPYLLGIDRGQTGQFKSWWLDNLCPTPLKNYLFTGKIDPQGKDILTLIAEYLFINIDDQLKELNKQNENALKNLITTPAVKYRRPYDVYIEESPPRQLHGFGERQRVPDRPDRQQAFLPFEVLRIDKPTAESIRMDNVYSEIMYLYRQGVRYWFNDAEIGELHLTNTEFEVQTVEFEMLTQYFEKPTEGKKPCFYDNGTDTGTLTGYMPHATI